MKAMSRKTKGPAPKEEAVRTLVPKLRFPEFRGTEEWKCVRLQDASVPVTERVGTPRLRPLGELPKRHQPGR